jgi:hypothetical protein
MAEPIWPIRHPADGAFIAKQFRTAHGRTIHPPFTPVNMHRCGMTPAMQRAPRTAASWTAVDTGRASAIGRAYHSLFFFLSSPGNVPAGIDAPVRLLRNTGVGPSGPVPARKGKIAYIFN